MHGLNDGHKMKHHAQVGGMEGESVQEFLGARERNQNIHKSEGIQCERNPQPDGRHGEKGEPIRPVWPNYIESGKHPGDLAFGSSRRGFRNASLSPSPPWLHALRFIRSGLRVERMALVYPLGFFASRSRCPFLSRRGPNSSLSTPSGGSSFARCLILSSACSGNSFTSSNSSQCVK